MDDATDEGRPWTREKGMVMGWCDEEDWSGWKEAEARREVGRETGAEAGGER